MDTESQKVAFVLNVRKQLYRVIKCVQANFHCWNFITNFMNKNISWLHSVGIKVMFNLYKLSQHHCLSLFYRVDGNLLGHTVRWGLTKILLCRWVVHIVHQLLSESVQLLLWPGGCYSLLDRSRHMKQMRKRNKMHCRSQNIISSFI